MSYLSEVILVKEIKHIISVLKRARELAGMADGFECQGTGFADKCECEPCIVKNDMDKILRIEK